MMVAISFLFETRFPFSFNKSLLEFKALLLKQGSIVFQKLRLPGRSLTLRFLKYSVLVLRRRSTQKVLCFL